MDLSSWPATSGPSFRSCMSATHGRSTVKQSGMSQGDQGALGMTEKSGQKGPEALRGREAVGLRAGSWARNGRMARLQFQPSMSNG